MSGIIRDTFIALHSSDVLARLDAEFRERYKGYKVPVISLRTMQMMKSLGIAADTSDSLAAIDDQAEEELADKAAGTFSLIAGEDLKKTRGTKAEMAAEGESEEAALDEDEDLAEELGGSENSDLAFSAGSDPASSSKMSKAELKKIVSPGSGGSGRGAGRKRSSELADEAKKVKKDPKVGLEGKFVDLTALLPPLPKKGEFDVSKIKSSLYFFS